MENRGSHEISSSDCSDDHVYVENNENRTGIQHPEINRESTSRAEQGIEITLLPASSSLDPQSFNNPGLVLKELFEPGTTAETLLGQCQSFDQRSSDYRFNGSIFPMEVSSLLVSVCMYICFIEIELPWVMCSPSAKMFYGHSLFLYPDTEIFTLMLW